MSTTAVYIVQGFSQGCPAVALTVPARFTCPQAARQHALLLGTFCHEVRLIERSRASLEAMCHPAYLASGQEKARMGDSGF